MKLRRSLANVHYVVHIIATLCFNSPSPQGNPRYQSQVYNALVALLSSASSEAQRMAAYTLRLIQPSMGVASPTIVDPVLELLQSLHLEVQFEGEDGLCSS